MEQDDPPDGPRHRWAGIGVDASGNPVVDPTKNVLDLVRAESRYQNSMREAADRLQSTRVEWSDKYHTAIRDADAKLQNWMRDSEAARTRDLGDLKVIYEARIAEMLRTSMESSSTLVSSQITQMQSTFNSRVSQLEKFRYELGGKTSVADPALAEALNKMSAAVSSLQSREVAHTNRGAGRSDVVAWVVAGVMALTTVGTLIMTAMHIPLNPTIGVDTKRVDDLIAQTLAANAAVTDRLNALSARMNSIPQSTPKQ